MIIIGFGSNVTSRFGESDATIFEAMRQMQQCNIRILRHSRLYRTTPYGLTSQPDFINAAALVRTFLSPCALLSVLKGLERRAGRSRTARWGPRGLDLDIIDYNRRILNWNKRTTSVSEFNYSTYHRKLILPHPGIAFRPFVLRPILDIAPLWHHPVTGQNAQLMYKRLTSAKLGRVLGVVDGDIHPENAVIALHDREKAAT
ncbi:MAG: 2-amino-4-hydroxy-6-hydroxymethyldihydropteridine diphosphokinase [Rhodomicrobium sp.]|nr:2-amino-4-hydroxy-6-hydroxymethyldihydropteridine diphosphokinase [Rhodomicrobium sp.]